MIEATLGILIILIIGILVMLTIIALRVNELNKTLDNFSIEESKLSINETESLITFIRDLVSKLAVIKWQSFIDSRSKDENVLLKVSDASVKNVVEDIARTSMNAIKLDIFSIDHLIVTESFLTQYIAETSAMFTKDLLSQTIEKLGGYEE